MNNLNPSRALILRDMEKAGKKSVSTSRTTGSRMKGIVSGAHIVTFVSLRVPLRHPPTMSRPEASSQSFAAPLSKRNLRARKPPPASSKKG